MLVNCARCKGQKKISQLGFMQVQCDVCKGAGYIKQNEIEIGEIIPEIVGTKKRGRPVKSMDA